MTDRYEDIRRALLARGYLQGPVERFVLAPALSASGPRALVAASLKAALLGAPIVGGVLAGSVVISNRPLLGPKDALMLWIDFGIAAGLVLFALYGVTAAIGARRSRVRGIRSADSYRAGLIVAVPVLAYLVLLWVFGRGPYPWIADVLFLTGALAAATFVAWLAGLVSLASVVGRTGDAPDRSRRFVVAVMAVLVPVAGTALAVAAWLAPPLGATAPSVHAPPTDHGRLIVVGVDGLEGSFIETSAADRGMPALLGLLAEGAVYPKKHAVAEPAEVWTTIATGMPAGVHGIREAGASHLPGIDVPIATRRGPLAVDAALRYLLPTRTVPASGAARRARALWEMTGWDRRSAVVGWWATWPARGTKGDPADSYVVSDRALAKLLLRAPDERDVAPPALFGRLAADFPEDLERWREEFGARFADVPESAKATLWDSFLIDAFAWRTAVRLLDDPDLGSLFVYLPGLDILRVRGAQTAAARDAYLAWLDGTVFARLTAKPGDRIVVIADPGRKARTEGEGFVGVIGGGVDRACVGPSIGDLDVAPIVLRAAALPISAEMSGRAPRGCFAGEERPAIATWGRRARSNDPVESRYDPEMVERLKSLGYVR